MQRAPCSKPEEDICAVCTNNAHRWILLYCSAGMQPYLGQCFKGQVSSIQVVKARLGFPLNQHPFDLHIGRSVDVVPLDFASLCTRFDIAAFPSTVLALANAFSPSRHRCFLLLFRPSSDPLFSPSSFTAGIIIQNWAKYKNNPAFAMFFQGQM